MQWFRLYGDIIDDSKIRLLAFEDRWHYVAVCAMKCNGLVDKPDTDLRSRMMAVALGVQVRELEEIKRRLIEVDLIDQSWHPTGWDKRQYKQPDLPKGESLEGYKGYVYFISDARMETVKIGYSKNPWARVKDLQTGRTAKLKVLATVKTTDTSEADVHRLFAEERRNGEWFEFSERIQSLVEAIKAKKVKDTTALADYVATTVVTTKETETETDTETEVLEPKGSCASGDALKPAHIFEKWNEVAARIGKRQVRDLTPSRAQLLRSRIAQYAIADFQNVFEKVERSAFLREGRFCTFDWIIKRGNFQKIIEGNYDD